VRIYGLLADILEYPGPRIAEQAHACAAALEPMSGKAREHLEKFAQFCKTGPVSRLEELYTDTFDLQAICCPYVGYHLFGEDRGRGMFMVKLKEHYRAQNYAIHRELPDHISVMLRLLSVQARGDEIQDLISYCLIPALQKMIPLIKDSGNPYQDALQAVLTSLEMERDRS
jgi:nitrate reductase molybdenum cofactor assembly chaperone NarJ/NarW